MQFTLLIFLELYLFSNFLFGEEAIYLKTPHICHENIIGTNVGIRPYRKSWIRLELESLDDKTIIHNYGYGGSGVSLCFGGANEVLNLLQDLNKPCKKVAILGAGVVGLATAYDLLKKGYEVNLYSDAWSPHLTSNVAAGIWTPNPFPVEIPLKKMELYQRMVETSEQRLINSIGEFSGIKYIQSYSIGSKVKEGDEVIFHFDNGLMQSGKCSVELSIDESLFLEDLFSKVRTGGAKLIDQHFESLEDLSLEESTIINCTSMGSIKLFGDKDFLPIRGHLIYLKTQEGVDYLFSRSLKNLPNEPYYFFLIYPQSERIVLGGTYEFDEDQPIIQQEVIDRILDNTKKCLSENF